MLRVSITTYDRITDLARAWHISEDEALLRLLDFWKAASSGSHRVQDDIGIHAVYRGIRAEGVFHPSTRLIDLVSGPGAGRVGLKPSKAAAAVIAEVNPDLNPTRNGWVFWVVDASGQHIDSLRGMDPT